MLYTVVYAQMIFSKKIDPRFDQYCKIISKGVLWQSLAVFVIKLPACQLLWVSDAVLLASLFSTKSLCQ